MEIDFALSELCSGLYLRERDKMKTPKSLMLPKFTDIRSLKQAEEIIRELTKAVENFNRYVYGDLANHEERITTLEP